MNNNAQISTNWFGLRNLTASVLARWKIWWKTSSPERIDWECWWKISSHSLFIRFSNPGIEYYTASSSSMSEKYPWLRRGSNKDILHVSNVFVVAAPPHPPTHHQTPLALRNGNTDISEIKIKLDGNIFYQMSIQMSDNFRTFKYFTNFCRFDL